MRRLMLAIPVMLIMIVLARESFAQNQSNLPLNQQFQPLSSTGQLWNIPPPDDLPDHPSPAVITTPQECAVRSCGFPALTYCVITCDTKHSALCSCDCSNRVLGVCTELKAFCTCRETKFRAMPSDWWPF